jgi:hypothetical protein
VQGQFSLKSDADPSATKGWERRLPATGAKHL